MLNLNSTRIFKSKISSKTGNFASTNKSYLTSQTAGDFEAEKRGSLKHLGCSWSRKLASQRSVECSPDGSEKSCSTIDSPRALSSSGYTSDSSDCANSEGFYTFSQTVSKKNLDVLSPLGVNASINFEACAANTQGTSICSIETKASPKSSKTRRSGKNRKTAKAQICSENAKSESLYKTELCKNWIEKGKCRYSVRCRFAHGPHELVKSVTKPEKTEYKSKLCVNFHTHNFCPYGVRCSFIHEDGKVSSRSDNFFNKSLLLNEEARKKQTHRRLPIFACLSEDSE